MININTIYLVFVLLGKYLRLNISKVRSDITVKVKFNIKVKLCQS